MKCWLHLNGFEMETEKAVLGVISAPLYFYRKKKGIFVGIGEKNCRKG